MIGGAFHTLELFGSAGSDDDDGHNRDGNEGSDSDAYFAKDRFSRAAVLAAASRCWRTARRSRLAAAAATSVGLAGFFFGPAIGSSSHAAEC